MLRAYDVHVLYESRNLDCPTSDVCTDNSQTRLSVPPKIPWQISDSSDCILACQISFSQLTWISSKQFYPFQDFHSEQIQRSCRKIFTALITHAGMPIKKKTLVMGTTNRFIFQNSLIESWGGGGAGATLALPWPAVTHFSYSLTEIKISFLFFH